MNAIRTEYTPPAPGPSREGIIRTCSALDSVHEVSYVTIIRGNQPKIRHHRDAAMLLLDKHYPDWRMYQTLVTAWYAKNTYIHIAAPNAELSPEGLI